MNTLLTKRFVFAVICTIVTLFGFGQDMTIVSVELLPLDISASTSKRIDNIGKPCGLVKVVLPLEDVTFEGNTIGDVDFKSGEYWVYLSSGSKYLKVKHPQYKPLFVDFSNYDIQSINSSSTYQIIIDSQIKEPDVDVTFKVYPHNAVLTIDQKEYPTVNGMAVVPLSPKEHNYTVVAYGYKTYGNKFHVYPDQSNKIVVELEPANNGNDVMTDNSQPNGAAVNNNSGSRPGTGSDYVEPTESLNMKMVWVEGGDFLMGGTAEQGSDVYDDELVIRRVKLDSYYISECEVTQAQWTKVMGSSIQQQARKADTSDFYGVGPDYPMYYVSWEEAQAFCRELSRMTGRKYCLPTEAQWEYAARGGKNADGTKYSGSESVDAVAWHKGNSSATTHPVKGKRANSLGLYDMSGNVWEWCSDWFNSTYSENDTNNPTGPTSGTNTILRGGSWSHDARSCRVSNRGDDNPTRRGSKYGFRVVVLP